MSMTQQLKLLLTFALFFIPPLAKAETDSRQQLMAEVEAFLWQTVSDSYPDATEIKLTIRPPDSRLNLDACVDPTLELHGNDRIRPRVLVRATCSPTYAIHLSANVEVLEQVVVADGALSRKHTLNAGDLTLNTVNILSNQRQYLTAIDQAVGNTLTRSVRSGTALTRGMIKAPELVTRGDSVVIVASRGELVVRMPGIAMMTGGLNDQINVRNQSSDRVVKGWIKGPGEVHVPF
jgi:flagella basal body P-ring formation protein FlgA